MADLANSTIVPFFPPLVEREIAGCAIRTVNARDLHRALSVGKVFRAWIAERIAAYGFKLGVDFEIYTDLRCPELDAAKARVQTAKEYALTLDMAKELAMVERNEAGKRVRSYFIECESKLREGSVAPVATTPNLRDPKQLLGVALQLVDINKELAAYKDMAEPKVALFDHVMDSGKLFGLRQTARVLGVKPKVFVKALEIDFLFREGGTLVAYAKHVEAGLFKVRVLTDGEGKTLVRTFVTPKGLHHLSRHLGTGAVVGNTENDDLIPGNAQSVAGRMIRLVSRPFGASLQELSAISGMAEQTALSRISKLRKHQGFHIVREKSDGRFYLRPRPGAH